MDFKKTIFTLSFSFMTFFMFAQEESRTNLEASFYDFDVISIDAFELHQKTQGNDFHIVSIPKPDGGKWVLEVYNSNLLSDNYISRYADDNGSHFAEKTKAIPTKGQIVGNGQSSTSLTFNEDFIYGYIRDESGYTFIEPLYYYEKGEEPNQFVIYHESDVKPEAPHTCGMTEMHDKRAETKNLPTNDLNKVVDECYEVDYAIANDFLMFQEFGSVAATENHAIGVTNNVQTNYDDEFTDELQFIIVEQFTPTTSGADPWTNSTSASALLNSFSDWGPGGFAATHDVGSIWTDRNFDGSTIGIAWLSVVCTGNRYNALQNFTTNPNTKRVMVAHELGHNFSAGHDGSGSGFIMAPSVNTSTTWSAASISSIESHIASRWCLADCAGSSVPPSASFDYNIIEDCTPGLVQFTSTSSGSTLSYDWDFPGGVPASSSDEDPFVTYDNDGTYDVTLTVTNAAGSDVETLTGQITISPTAEAEFSYAIDGTQVSFFNFSSNAVSYFWEFGDGATSSQSDPVHDYIDDGVYIAELTATNICGDVTSEEVIVIANPPVAEFTSSVQSGCAPLTVSYTSQASSNTDTWFWTFEGGTPSSSELEDPVVVYNTAGVFEVILTVENETGTDMIIIEDYITVGDIPEAEFSASVDGSTVTFTNESVDGDTYLWNFGDGNTSEEANPSHTYDDDGNYDVTLTVTNDCGSDIIMLPVEISLLLVASFQTTSLPEGCASLEVAFENTSTNNPDTYAWTFEGGNPATSTDENPMVNYDTQGTYDVTLVVTNANGNNTILMEDFVVVNDVPTADFSVIEDGLTATFMDESNDADTYMWDFGDGNSSTLSDPVHTYAAEGNYEVMLSVTNECGTTTTTSTVNNYTPVEANFNASNTEGCSDFVVDFEDFSSDNATTWMWTFEGGSPATSTLQNPTVTYTESGSYDVSLTVSHPESTSTIEFADYILVSDVPTPTFDYFDNLFEVDFTNTTMGGDSYMWDFGDGDTSTEENPTHTYADEGTYSVELIVTNECGEASLTQTIEINNLPTANFNVNDADGCGPLVVDFENNSSDNVTAWLWTFEGGNPAMSTDENPQVTYTTPGTYDVTLEVTSPAGTDVIEMPDFVEVFTAPSPAIDAQLDGNILIANNTGSGTELTWTVDGTTVMEDVLEYTFPANGTYLVTLTASNECGNETVEVEVEIDVYAEVSIALGSLPFTACIDEPLILTENSINAETYSWILQGASPATSAEMNPEVTYSAAGTYDLELEVGNQYGTSTMVFPGAVVVVPGPTAEFTGNLIDNEVIFTNLGENGDSYSWDFGDGSSSDEKDPVHTYTTNGIFDVYLIVTNACGQDTPFAQYQIVSNSVTEAQLSSLNLFPNPTSGLLNLEFDNTDNDAVKIEVLDISGRLLLQSSFDGNSTTLNVENFANGTYLLRLTSKEANVYKKFVLLN